MENKPWIFRDEGVYESINEELGGGARYSFAYVKFNGSSDYVKKYRDLIASAPSLQSEIDRLKEENEKLKTENQTKKESIRLLMHSVDNLTAQKNEKLSEHFGKFTCKTLKDNYGITTVEEALKLSDNDLMRCKGIGRMFCYHLRQLETKIPPGERVENT